MEWLPEEVVEVIAEHLTSEDLVSCCAVSVSWREMFGRDRLWRPHHDPSLSAYLATSQPVVQPGFLSPETPNSALTTISPTRLGYMRERHLQNNWSFGNYKVDTTPNGFLNYYSTKISYNNDYILEFFNHKINVWEITKTPSLHSSYPFHIEPNDGVRPFVLDQSNKIVTEQCGVVRVLNLNLTSKELQVTLLFSVEMSEKCQDVSDTVMRALFKKSVRASCTVVGNVLVATVYEHDNTVPSLHVWDVENGQKLMEENCAISMDNDFVIIEFKSCCKTKSVVIIYIFHDIRQNTGFRYYQVLNLSQLKVYPFLKMFNNVIEDFYDFFHYDCAICSHYIAIREEEKVFVYDYLSSELIYTSDTMGSICFWRNNIVFQNNHQILVVDITTTDTVAQFEVEYLSPRVVADNAIYINRYEDGFISFVARRELLNSKTKNKNKSSVPLYSFRDGRPLFINKARTKIVVGDDKSFVVVNFW